MLFCQLIVGLKVFCDQINSGTADSGEWLGHSSSVQQPSMSSTARGFKVTCLGGGPIRDRPVDVQHPLHRLPGELLLGKGGTHYGCDPENVTH